MGIGELVLETKIPLRKSTVIRRGQKKEIEEKIFPGYVLVRMVLTDDSWLVVRTTPGVTGFVGTQNRPTPLSPTEVDTVLRFAETAAPKFKSIFSIDEAVKIIDGSFTDFVGTIDSIDEARGKLKVLVSIFGRETPVELDFLQIAKL